MRLCQVCNVRARGEIERHPRGGPRGCGAVGVCFGAVEFFWGGVCFFDLGLLIAHFSAKVNRFGVFFLGECVIFFGGVCRMFPRGTV